MLRSQSPEFDKKGPPATPSLSNREQSDQCSNGREPSPGTGTTFRCASLAQTERKGGGRRALALARAATFCRHSTERAASTRRARPTQQCPTFAGIALGRPRPSVAIYAVAVPLRARLPSSVRFPADGGGRGGLRREEGREGGREDEQNMMTRGEGENRTMQLRQGKSSGAIRFFFMCCLVSH